MITVLIPRLSGLKGEFMKKRLCVILALLIVTFFAARAIAAALDEPDVAGAAIDSFAFGDGNWESPPFTIRHMEGRYLRFWHNNATDSEVEVILLKYIPGQGYQPADHLYVPPHTNNRYAVYMTPDETATTTFKLAIENHNEPDLIRGAVNAAQYPKMPVEHR